MPNLGHSPKSFPTRKNTCPAPVSLVVSDYLERSCISVIPHIVRFRQLLTSGHRSGCPTTVDGCIIVISVDHISQLRDSIKITTPARSWGCVNAAVQKNIWIFIQEPIPMPNPTPLAQQIFQFEAQVWATRCAFLVLT